MDAITAPLWMMAKKKNCYEKYAAAGTTYWQSTQQYKAVVPTDRRWILIGGSVNRSQAATLIITARDASDDIIMEIESLAAGTGLTTYPNVSASTAIPGLAIPLVLDEDEYINIAFGAAQDTNAYASCIVLEVYKP